MENKTILLFGIHMHQPVDNFGWVIEHAITSCYEPFFEVMSRYPAFRFSVHCSGWLMEQIEERNPTLYHRIQELANKGSIEFFSGGYYEPILSVIPSEDRVEQIHRLNDSIQKGFNQTPKGLWLTERVWESSLIPDLDRSGMHYTVMDDYHFQCAGFEESVLDGYYMSEEGGIKLGLFPISKKLRYAIPFFNVDSAIGAIKSYTREKDSAAILFDDAEKFGMWPGTYEWVYTKGWLERFVEAVLSDISIQTMQYGEYMADKHPRGIAYLPNVSYCEMGEWSLRAENALKLEELKHEMGFERFEREGIKFLKGGIWKNFFVKYPESNRIHKRMIELSQARLKVADKAFDTALYKLQTNDPLWHGVFGGLYLPNLRDNAYRYLIECENIRYKTPPAILKDQNELDGYDKIKIVTPELIWRFDSACGGQLVEFDSRADCFNWQNTLTRRKEAYHERMFNQNMPREEHRAVEGIDTIHHAAMEIDKSLVDNIIYDWYLKNSFIDHISDAQFTLENFRHCAFREYGDFANQPFECSIEESELHFWRDGGIYFPDKEKARLEKIYRPLPTGMEFEITLLTNSGAELVYILEYNFHFSDYDKVLMNDTPILETGRFDDISRLEITDEVLQKKICICLGSSCEIAYFKLKTLSQSEHGVDLTVQGISIAIILPFTIGFSLSGRIEVSDV